MIGFDTNVIVRLLVADDPEQYERVLEEIRRAESEREPIFLSTIVLCEVTWVLASVYDVPRKRVGTSLRSLLEDSRFMIERAPVVRAALARFERGRADFADYLIGELARAEGAHTTATFDRTLRRETGFTLL